MSNKEVIQCPMTNNIYQLKTVVNLNANSFILDANGKEVFIDGAKEEIGIEDTNHYKLPSGMIETIAEKIRVVLDYPLPTFRDESLDEFLSKIGFETQDVKFPDVDIILYKGAENLPYIKKMYELLSKVYPPHSARFLELAFLHNLFFRSESSVRRIGIITGFEDYIQQQGIEKQNILINAVGSTGRGFALEKSDIELSFFDKENVMDEYSRWPGMVLGTLFKDYCAKRGFISDSSNFDACVKYYSGSNIDEALSSSHRFPTLDLFLGNLFSYNCYGDFYAKRKEVMDKINPEQFEDLIHGFLVTNTLLERHQPRLMALIEQREDYNLLPPNIKLPVTMEYLISIKPRYEEFKAIYS